MCAAESSVERVSLKPTEKVKWDHVHLAYSDSEFLKLKKFKVAATHKLAAESIDPIWLEYSPGTGGHC